MSKAFTRETDNDDEEESLPACSCRRGVKKLHLTGGHARLKAELDHLLRVERRMSLSRRLGGLERDRSENGDYIYGKRRLREIDRRIRFPDQAARHRRDRRSAQAAEPGPGLLRGDRDDLRPDGTENTYHRRRRRNRPRPRPHQLGVAAGASADQAKEGDSVRFQSPAGIREIDIVAVEYKAIEGA